MDTHLLHFLVAIHIVFFQNLSFRLHPLRILKISCQGWRLELIEYLFSALILRFGFFCDEWRRHLVAMRVPCVHICNTRDVGFFRRQIMLYLFKVSVLGPPKISRKTHQEPFQKCLKLAIGEIVDVFIKIHQICRRQNNVVRWYQERCRNNLTILDFHVLEQKKLGEEIILSWRTALVSTYAPMRCAGPMTRLISFSRIISIQEWQWISPCFGIGWIMSFTGNFMQSWFPTYMIVGLRWMSPKQSILFLQHTAFCTRTDWTVYLASTVDRDIVVCVLEHEDMIPEVISSTYLEIDDPSSWYLQDV